MKRIFLTSIAWAALTGSPQAHAFLDNAVPMVGAIITAPPKEIRIQFTEAVEPGLCRITLLGPDGQPVALGTIAGDPADPERLVVPVTATLAPGNYRIKWNVVAVDTHRTNGDYPFTYKP